MKKDTHPELHPVIFRDKAAGADFIATSTMTSDKMEKIDGADHFVVEIEVSSASHPHYTGKANVIDTAGRVEKFKQRASRKGN